MTVPTGDARILDRGYRRYDGPRAGTAHAVRSVIAHTLRRILGLRRPARAKVLPVMAVAFAYIPAIVFVGIVALSGRFGAQAQADLIVPPYAEYYGFIISAIVLFVTFVAPEALCPDRRSRSLSLYLSSPLTRMTYLLGKVLAVTIVVAFVTVGPPLLLLLGRMMQSAGPDGFVAFLGVLGRMLASGAMLAAIYTAVSMGVASLTDRRAVAAAATLLLLIGSSIVTGTIVFGLDGPSWVFASHLTAAPLLLVGRIYGESTGLPEVSTLALTMGALAWTALGSAVCVLRYRSLQVTR